MMLKLLRWNHIPLEVSLLYQDNNLHHKHSQTPKPLTSWPGEAGTPYN